MNEDISKKLWVVKFCIKVVYPKYNHYTFLVFLAIKFRIWCKKTLFGSKGMDKFEVKTIPSNIAHLLVSDRVENKLPVVIDKCIIISKEQYIQLCSENLFYVDNGLLWLGMKLSPEHKINQKHKQNISRKRSNILRYNLNLVTSEIHKKLWSTDNIAYSLDSIRIVPVVGSKQVLDNIAFTNENEFHNIFSSFGIEDDKIAVTFHPLPSLEYAPKIAMTAEVSLIVNEFDISNDFTKELLNNFFEVPKLVSINDVFSIELTQETTGKYHYKYLEVVQTSERLYFKCNKLVGDAGDSDKNHSKDVIKALFVVKGVTQLSLGENIHMLKPKQEFFNVQDSTRNYDLIDLCPTGLKYKFEALQEAIGPFITGDMGDLSSSLSSPIIPMLLLTGALGSGRHLIVKTLAKYNGMNYLSIDCNGLQSSTAKQTESKINATVQKAKASSPVIVVLDNFEVFAVDPENNEDCRVIEYFLNTITDLYINYTKHLIIFIAITERQDLKPNILRLFLETFHINKPNSEERYEMLEWFFRAMQLSLDDYSKEHSQKEMVSKFNLDQTSKDILRRVAAKTETFLYGDLDTLLHFAMRESYLKQLSNFNQLPPDPDLRVVKEEDFDSALESIRNLQSQHLDAPKIPKVYWEDIGGLEKLKKEILKTIEFPIKYPHLFKNSSLKRSGILMYGPPGCGKTLVAKAVSTELNVSFLSVKGPELLNMYIGQSEENVRKVFQTARSSSPCIIFLDEVDAVAPRRGAAGDSGGAADRVVSQLLAELDGVQDDAEEASVVFVMGATNRPDLVERSLLRPGRLDTAVYVGPYVARQRHAVLAALCSRLRLRPEVDLQRVCDALPERCTGADLMAVVSAARAAATRTLVHNLQTGVIKESDLSPDSVIIGVSEMWQGVEAFKPSVSDEELDYYESLQSQM